MYKVQGSYDQFLIFVVEDQGHDHVRHDDRDRGRGEVGQCHVGVKGIAKNKGRGEILRCLSTLLKKVRRTT